MFVKKLLLGASFILGAALLVGCEEQSQQVAFDSTGHFVLAAGMPLKQQKLMQQDLDRLRALQISSLDDARAAYLKRAMGITAVDANELFHWLTERVKFIVGESLELDESTIVELGRFPSRFNSATDAKIPFDFVAAGDLRIAMINLGAALYMAGKHNQLLLGLRIPGWDTVVPVHSPRAGIIQVGEALFSVSMNGEMNGEDKNNKNTLDTAAYSLFRAAVFFHESRHSDGHNSSLAFAHIKCPSGHQYSGVPACDNNENGPYGIEARLLGVFRDNCTTCSEKEKFFLKLQEAENLSRVTCAQNQTVAREDTALQDSVVAMCRELKEISEQYNLPLPESCKDVLNRAAKGGGSAGNHGACWWDAAPVGV